MVARKHLFATMNHGFFDLACRGILRATPFKANITHQNYFDREEKIYNRTVKPAIAHRSFLLPPFE